MNSRFHTLLWLGDNLSLSGNVRPPRRKTSGVGVGEPRLALSIDIQTIGFAWLATDHHKAHKANC